MNGLREDGHGLGRPMFQMMLAGRGLQVLDLLGCDVGQCLFAIHSQLLTPGANTRNGYRPLTANDLGEGGVVGIQERGECAEGVALVAGAAALEL